MKKIIFILVVIASLFSCQKEEVKEPNPIVGTWKQFLSPGHAKDEIWIFTENNKAWIGPKMDTLVYNYQYYLTEDKSHVFVYNLDNDLILDFDVKFDSGKIDIMSTFFKDDVWYIFRKID